MAPTIKRNLHQVRASWPWLGAGTFGWTETQVQANTVARQPLMILKNVRQLLISSHEAGSRSSRESKGCLDKGRPLVATIWTSHSSRSMFEMGQGEIGGPEFSNPRSK
jgi:hypothetical protein